ncbi:MAG: ATP-binding protein [Lachnospiraceae bacterium]|nr:ATP-binding protein [Lachnospiraceae bacterium]MBR6273805.1 ATP-binding protein [Lachnospiraceae bacterium]
MKKLTIEAKIERLPEVLAFLDGILEEAESDMKAQMQLDIAVEEIYVNIASYAYEGAVGQAEIEIDISADRIVSVRFLDSGTPYDPLKKPDPDITLSADERAIGGLGIFMVKKSMDDMIYEYVDGKNVLTIKKRI